MSSILEVYFLSAKIGGSNNVQFGQFHPKLGTPPSPFAQKMK